MIIILGGPNDKKGNLHKSTINRLDKYIEIKNKYPNFKVILSGGYRFSSVSHCELIKKYLLDKEPSIEIEKEFIENNNTIDEAINISRYLLDISYQGNIIVITSPWHLQRAKYLFDIAFNSCSNINTEYISYISGEEMKQFDPEEKIKLENLKYAPYGKWKVFVNNLKI